MPFATIGPETLVVCLLSAKSTGVQKESAFFDERGLSPKLYCRSGGSGPHEWPEMKVVHLGLELVMFSSSEITGTTDSASSKARLFARSAQRTSAGLDVGKMAGTPVAAVEKEAGSEVSVGEQRTRGAPCTDGGGGGSGKAGRGLVGG